MSAIDYLQKFNETFGEFGDDIVKVFPQDPEFRMYNIAIKGAMMMNKQLIHSHFYESVTVPFGDRILERDETFFLTHTYDDVKHELDGADELIDKIKHVWSQLKEGDRDVIWRYFRVLVLASRKIAGSTSA